MANKKLNYTAAEIDTLLGETKKLVQSGYAGEEIANLLGELESLLQLKEDGQLGGEDERVDDILVDVNNINTQLEEVKTQLDNLNVDNINTRLDEMDTQLDDKVDMEDTNLPDVEINLD